MVKERITYRSRIDWWVWLILAMPLLLMWPIVADTGTRITGIILCGVWTAMNVALMSGCRYEIDGEELVIYQMFRPTRLPILKIRDVRKTSGYLATAGMSHLRVSIRFTDRAVLKSYAPLEISPKDRDGFIAALMNINPDIKELV